MHSLPQLKIAVLGAQQTGKSAIVVRYLTRRFISEYCSQSDFLYRHAMYLDERTQVEVDILDTSGRLETADLLAVLDWATALVLVYSVTDEGSFSYADHLLQTISQLQTDNSHHPHHHPLRPVILLANKADLEQARKVMRNQGEVLSCRYSSLGCSFFEVAAAGEAYHEIVHAFRLLIRQSKAAIMEQLFEVLDCSDKRSNSSNSSGSSSSLKVTRIFGQMLARMGKKSSTTTGTATELATTAKPTKKMKKKKQKSLSI